MFNVYPENSFMDFYTFIPHKLFPLQLNGLREYKMLTKVLKTDGLASP